VIDPKKIDQLAQQLADAVPPGLKRFKEDSVQHFRAILQAGLAKLDVVPRDEFDAQVRVLERTRERLEHLEKQLEILERQTNIGDT